MALTTQQKKDILQGMIDSVDADVFRTEMQLAAYQAEVSAAADDNSKAAAQANVDNTQANLTAMQARQSAWQNELSKIK